MSQISPHIGRDHAEEARCRFINRQRRDPETRLIYILTMLICAILTAWILINADEIDQPATHITREAK
ncbi:hypothetical protein ACMYR3_06060 [Ampullimonas aquatilis]|uniref:hypothetical protein n=1 Tax=Ampullimonas aquatilis TaxID=1341549 RepID=UPI003C74CE24